MAQSFEFCMYRRQTPSDVRNRRERGKGGERREDEKLVGVGGTSNGEVHHIINVLREYEPVIMSLTMGRSWEKADFSYHRRDHDSCVAVDEGKSQPHRISEKSMASSFR
jgi:hypothetical protein